MKLSVIVNCYNGAAYLREALDSVVAQDWQDYELVFVDNHSTDASAQIFASYADPRFRRVVPQCFLPLGEARNVGVAHCGGEFLAFLDADDVWLPGKLSGQLRAMQASGADALYSQATMFYADGRKRPYAKRRGQAMLGYAELAGEYDVCLSTLMLRRAALDRLDRIFDGELAVAEDADLMLRMAHMGRVVYLDDVTTRYRVHGNSDSWKKPEAFLGDLKRITADYQRRDMDVAALAPLFDTAYWVVMMAKWASGENRAAREALSAIARRSGRHRVMALLLGLPYRWIAPVLRLFGKRVI